MLQRNDEEEHGACWLVAESWQKKRIDPTHCVLGWCVEEAVKYAIVKLSKVKESTKFWWRTTWGSFTPLPVSLRRTPTSDKI